MKHPQSLDKTHLWKITSALPSTILSRIDFYQTLPLQMCMSMGHQAGVITAAHLRGKRRSDVTGAELALCWLSVTLILNCCWVGEHD